MKFLTSLTLFLFSLGMNPIQVCAQKQTDKELIVNLNDEGTHYLKTTITAQIWARYNQNNPGSTLSGFASDQQTDIGIRRMRSQIFGKISNRVFFYTQFGINNFNVNAARKPALFLHDVVAEYALNKRTVQMGMGLSGWTGFARYSSPAIASFLGLDAPIYQQSTNDATDQYLRKFSFYMKGKMGKIDYRVVASKPMWAQNSTVIKPISLNSDFSYQPAYIQYSAYFMYQFWDEESNLTPYLAGTYRGSKSIFNIGAGFQYQQNAMWHWRDEVKKDTILENMRHLAADVFYEQPLGEKGASVSAYFCIALMDYGKNYIRNNGPMNPADAGTTDLHNFNGGGNLYPMYGSGNIYFTQFGYQFPANVFKKENGELQVYMMLMNAGFNRLNQNMLLYDIGSNWYIDNNRAKLTFDYQNRPVYDQTDLRVNSHRGMFVLQYQIAI